LNRKNDINNTLRAELKKSIQKVIDTKHSIMITGFSDKIRISRIKRPFTKTELENIIEILGFNDYTFNINQNMISIDFHNKKNSFEGSGSS
jgi:hypothetical protein